MPARALHILLFASGLALLAGCAGVQSPGSGPAAEAPAYRVGDRWVYSAVDGFRATTTWQETHEVMTIGTDGFTLRVTQKGPAIDIVRTEQWPAPGRLKVGALYKNEIRRFAPPVDVYDFPLAGGKIWNQWVDAYNERTGASGQINYFVRVRGWEKIATPAGTFDALAMQVLMRLDDEEFWREPTQCNYLVWYAPAVRGIVRALKKAQYFERGGDFDARFPIPTQNTVLELVSFTPGGA